MSRRWNSVLLLPFVLITACGGNAVPVIVEPRRGGASVEVRFPAAPE